MKSPIFRLDGASFSYPPDIAALDRVDLTVNEGESLVILGSNGCGKSTLLRILGGLIHPDSGTTEAFGEAVSEARLDDDLFRRFFRQRVGILFQNPDIQLFSATVWEDALFGPLQMDLPPEEAKRRADDVLALLGIERLAQRPPTRLSGGEKKKAALAAVLALNPSVLLLDEPTTALDPRTRHLLLELLNVLSAAGKTLVTATHDLDFARNIATRVVVLSEEHRVVADGLPGDILSDRRLLLSANLIHESDPLPAVSSADASRTAGLKSYSTDPFAAGCKMRLVEE